MVDHAPSAPAPARPLRRVALVGVDGSGKTTQAHRLAAELTALGLPAIYRQNAGGRRWFGRLARLVGRRDAQSLLGRRGLLFVESVLRWLAIARAVLWSRPGAPVAVMDRYAVCQYVSIRAHARGPLRAGRRMAAGERMARVAYRVFPAPDVTFLMAVDPREAYRRIELRGTDHESIDYLRTAGAAYRELPESGSFVVIDADRSPDEVAAAIRAHLVAWLPPAAAALPHAAGGVPAPVLPAPVLPAQATVVPPPVPPSDAGEPVPVQARP